MTSARDTIDRIVEISHQLGAVVKEEIQILAERRPRDLADFQDEKLRLSQIYQSEMSSVREYPELLKGAEPHDIDRLKQATFYLHDILNEQRRRVQAAKYITENLLKTIGDEVVAKRQPPIGYGPNAMVRRPPVVCAGAAASIALDQVV